jgi:hypothetical protein
VILATSRFPQACGLGSSAFAFGTKGAPLASEAMGYPRPVLLDGDAQSGIVVTAVAPWTSCPVIADADGAKFDSDFCQALHRSLASRVAR